MIRRHRDASRSEFSHLAIPSPTGLEYMPYQRAGIEYMASRDRILLADEMGLGKTIQVIGLANYRDERKILVIPPATLKINWCREFEKWTAFDLKTHWINGRKDDLIAARDANVVVINYELLGYYEEFLREKTWNILAIDEAHYLKNSKADRTGQVFGRKRSRNDKPALSPIPFEKIILMTGTPIPNGKPKEIWPMLQVLDPEGLGSDWFAFAKRYCGLQEIKLFDPAQGKMVHKGWWWDGAENLDELQGLMRERFMIRRLKRDVLKELPPKTRQIVVLEVKKGLTKLFEHETLALEAWEKKYGDILIDPPEFSEMARIRKEIGVAKVPYAIEYLKGVLNEIENPKIAVWVHHHEVFDALRDAFPANSIGLDGRTNPRFRQDIIDRFQTDPGLQLFIGGIQAAGVGITLTAAHVAIFVETSGVPKDVTQTEDRLHRKGQKDNVLIRHLVLNGSGDQRRIQALIRRQDIADQALDK